MSGADAARRAEVWEGFKRPLDLKTHLCPKMTEKELVASEGSATLIVFTYQGVACLINSKRGLSEARPESAAASCTTEGL